MAPDFGVEENRTEDTRDTRLRSWIAVTLRRGTRSIPKPHERDRLKHVGRLEEGQVARAVRNGKGGAMRGWNPATRNPDNWRWTTTGYLVLPVAGGPGESQGHRELRLEGEEGRTKVRPRLDTSWLGEVVFAERRPNSTRFLREPSVGRLAEAQIPIRPR